MLDVDLSMRVATLRSVLATRGVMQALALLNERTDYRYTGIYKLRGSRMSAICIFDRHAGPRVWWNVLPLRASICRQMVCQGAFATRRASLDARLDHDEDAGIGESYCGQLLAHESGMPYGGLLHFDVAPRRVDAAVADFLEAAALLFRDCCE